MAFCKLYDPTAPLEISGALIMSFVHAVKRGVEARLAVLARHGIVDPTADGWYSMQKNLDAIREIHETVGEMTLVAMGRDVMLNYPFPPFVNDLRTVFEMQCNPISMLPFYRLPDIQLTAEMLEGLIGGARLLEFDPVKRRAVIRLNSVLPHRSMEGYINGLVERFKPADSTFYEVKEDITQERQSEGGDSTTFLIRW